MNGRTPQRTYLLSGTVWRFVEDDHHCLASENHTRLEAVDKLYMPMNTYNKPLQAFSKTHDMRTELEIHKALPKPYKP